MPRKFLSLGIADDMLADQALIVNNIKAIKNTKILFTSGNGKELLFKLQHTKPDILIIDLYMPIMSGWEVLLNLKQLNYQGAIICTTCGYETNIKNKLLALNVMGFAPKHTQSLTKAIQEVALGNQYFEIDYLPLQQNMSIREVEIDGREITIINKLAEGKDSKMIAEELGGLSHNSIDTYIKNLIVRFECKNRTQLVALAYMYGLIYTFESFNNLPKPTEAEFEILSFGY